MLDNIIMLSDSYKVSHHVQYPPDTKKVYSYFESRGGEFYYTKFFGLQYIIKRYLEGQVVTHEKIDYAKAMFKSHFFGNEKLFNEKGWRYIADKHNGRLPLKIKAVPEGTNVPVSNVLVTIENTDPECYWLTNYVETLLVQVWYPTTVCTISNHMKQILLEALEKSGDPSLIEFKLHDFGCRGVETMESAGIGGLSHNVNFKGTDTIPSLVFGKEYYGCDCAGFSIPASEHSTITSWGKEHEVDAMRNMLLQYPDGLIACVSDSFDIYKACREYWGTELKDLIINRNGTLVVRPDSGKADHVVPKCLDILGDKFGYITNEKGYKVLDPHVRMIQGDGIDRHSLYNILDAILKSGWSADNIAFGSGGGLLQQCNRDTLKFAFKCSSIVVGDERKDVYKQPIECSWKGSKKGTLKLCKHKGLYVTVNRDQFVEELDLLELVFLNGELKRFQTLDDIRSR